MQESSDTASRVGARRERSARAIEVMLLASRWLMLPVLFSLLAFPLLLGARAWLDVWRVASSPHVAERRDLILTALHCIDLVLVAGLVLTVALSVYEEMVSRIGGDSERPGWLGKIDSVGLKVKVVLSIVAIATIELLATALSVEQASDRALAWGLAIYATFLVGTLVMALALRLVGKSH